MLCPAGVLAPCPPGPPYGPVMPKWQRFYNWPRDANGQPMEDRPDFPKSEDIPEVIVEVPADSHHLRTLIYKGHCRLVDEPVASAPAPVKPRKKDNK